MTNELELRSPPVWQSLDTADEWIVRLHQLQGWVVTANKDEAKETYEQIRLLREFVRIKKMAHKIAVEASRLEVVVTRRLAQLDGIAHIPQGQRQAARWLADLSEEEFTVVLGQLKTPISPHRLFLRFSGVAQASKVANGTPSNPRRRARTYEHGDLFAAAKIVLEEAAKSETVLTVDVAAETLATQLGLIDHEDPVVHEAMRSCIRAALRHDNPEPGKGIRPDFVTYEESFGWVRIPWEMATLPQFRFMVEYRRRQAAELASRAAYLESLLRLMEEAGEQYDTDRCSDLWNEVVSGGDDLEVASDVILVKNVARSNWYFGGGTADIHPDA